MVERFVEAVLDRRRARRLDPRAHVHREGGRRAARARAPAPRGLGEDEHARAVDGAWIGTIHGFCARVLRSRPLAAGLDPRFDVLDEAAAGRLASAAYDRALDDVGRRARRARPSTSPPPTRASCATSMLDAHETLRSRGATEPRLPIPAERPAPSSGRARRRPRRRRGASSGAGRRRHPRRPRAAPRSRRASACSPPPAGCRPTRRARRGQARRRRQGAHDRRPARRTASAWEAYRVACADHHARAALILLDDLLARFAAGYAQAQGRARRRGLRGPRARRARPAGRARPSGAAGASGSR